MSVYVVAVVAGSACEICDRLRSKARVALKPLGSAVAAFWPSRLLLRAPGHEVGVILSFHDKVPRAHRTTRRFVKSSSRSVQPFPAFTSACRPSEPPPAVTPAAGTIRGANRGCV